MFKRKKRAPECKHQNIRWTHAGHYVCEDCSRQFYPADTPPAGPYEKRDA